MLNAAKSMTRWPRMLRVIFVASGCTFLLAGLYLLNSWAVYYSSDVILRLRIIRPRGDFSPLPPSPPALVSQSIDLASYTWVRTVVEGLAVFVILGAMIAILRQGLSRRTLLQSGICALTAALLIYIFTFTQISGSMARPSDPTVPLDPNSEVQGARRGPTKDPPSDVALYLTTITGLMTASAGSYGELLARRNE